jgi:hypothetical protein
VNKLFGGGLKSKRQFLRRLISLLRIILKKQSIISGNKNSLGLW